MYPYYFQPQMTQFQPYMTQMPQMQSQQVVQVNGRASIDAMKMPPNSSQLVMDTSAPIVWLCVSDGVGSVTATPYDISIHQPEEKKEAEEMEKRLAKLEVMIEKLEERINDKSHADTTNVTTSQAVNGYYTERKQSAGDAFTSPFEQSTDQGYSGLRSF